MSIFKHLGFKATSSTKKNSTQKQFATNQSEGKQTYIKKNLSEVLVNKARLSKLLTLALLCVANVQANAESLAITGAQIHTMDGSNLIESGTLLVEDGIIKDVVDGMSVPNGYTEINASGKVITPGFIGALTNIGLVEVSSSAGVVDHRVDAHPISTVGAAYDSQYAINSDSTLIDITRLEGFTSAVTGVSRTGQLFNGLGAVMSLDKSFAPLIKPKAYVHLDVGHSGAERNGDSRAALWVAIQQSLDEAIYAKSYDLSPSNGWEGMITRADAKVLIDLVDGKMPLLVTANRAADIVQALNLKSQYQNIDLVLVGVSDGWRVAGKIAQANVPVILNPEYNLPGAFDMLASTLENAARLHEAGVKIAIGIDTHNIRLAPQHAGNAVANGLPHSEGIAALTSNVAEIFGLEQTLGSLKAGMQADFVIWSGDPLEVTHAAEQVFINGKSMPMESRQTKLRDRYLKKTSEQIGAYVK